MNEIVKIRPFVQQDWEQLKASAEKDQHSGVYCPTHVSLKGNEIVGYLSVGVIPIVLTWQHREKVGPLDSARLMGFLEGALSNYKQICIPCDPDSPYNRLLPKAGYIEYTKPVKLYIKA
jgi:hypothetical protein